MRNHNTYIWAPGIPKWEHPLIHPVVGLAGETSPKIKFVCGWNIICPPHQEVPSQWGK